MATLEKRVEDLEYVIAHLPQDLDARFAGVDTKLAAIREVQLLHSQRFTTLELRIGQVEKRIGGLEARFDGLEARFDGLEKKVDGLSEGMAEVLRRLPPAP
jgi:uncharacterized coiled-coil protein SlyX